MEKRTIGKVLGSMVVVGGLVAILHGQPQIKPREHEYAARIGNKLVDISEGNVSVVWGYKMDPNHTYGYIPASAMGNHESVLGYEEAVKYVEECRKNGVKEVCIMVDDVNSGSHVLEKSMLWAKRGHQYFPITKK